MTYPEGVTASTQLLLSGWHGWLPAGLPLEQYTYNSFESAIWAAIPEALCWISNQVNKVQVLEVLAFSQHILLVILPPHSSLTITEICNQCCHSRIALCTYCACVFPYFPLPIFPCSSPTSPHLSVNFPTVPYYRHWSK